eukprot:gnl/MRDRNA2_/MRDRNA2_96194_c0_seq1.p1 gnl/MRDRNA2_/MRDRNA2_96194_c0~~gnl/MRDRNA2_/MRDRNA2_96194_c0_seq1.p1  ORF type:complete len:816 (+),score=233.30 gnl/MRDRNA2_/MRDRNA2_96194_c0_seq1:84-2531(+)
MSKVDAKKDVEMKEAEPEEDAAKDSRPKISTDIVTNDYDATLDVLVAGEGSIVTGLTADGFQYVLSGARANVGIKSGRYVYEAKVIEAHNPIQQTGRGTAPGPRNVLRVGFSTIKAALLMGVEKDEECVCIDNAGAVFVAGKRIPSPKQSFSKNDCIAVMLNLDKQSKNANTISFFKNGARVCAPIALPENLVDKVLYPSMTFKNVTVAVNYGGDLWKSLPFECTTISEAAQADVEMSPVKRPADGKYEVVCPVGMPNEGFFDYCDQFLQANPTYVELSDRSIKAWAEKSGAKHLGAPSAQDSLDKPIFAFGLPGLDDGSIQKMMKILASSAKRNVLVAQVKENLTVSDRAELLKSFKGSSYKKVAHVVIGDPPKAFKDYTLTLMKAAKEKGAEDKRASDEAKQNSQRLQKLNALKKKHTEAVRKHTMDKARRKADREKKKAQKAKEKEAAKKKKEAEKKKKEEERKKRVAEGAEPADAEPEEAEEEDKEEPEEEEPPEPKMTPEEEKEIEALSVPIKVELDPASLEPTEEEKKATFRKLAIPEMSQAAVSAAFSKFSIPANKEGWSDIKFLWSNRSACEKKLKDWSRNKKSTERVDDIVPSDWFKEKLEEWTKQREDLKKLHKEFQSKNEKPSKAEPDLSSCTDINDATGSGEPLYSKFEMEDWALLNLRFEVHLLIHAFTHDVNDEDRPGIHVEYFDFYYQKYYKRGFTLSYFGCKEFQEMLDLIKGTASIDEEKKVLNSELSGEDGMEELVKATEEARRERARRIDAGDETARLQFKVPTGAKRAGPQSAPPAKKATGPLGKSQWRPYGASS